MNNGIHDQAVMIGARKTLVGIVTQRGDCAPEDRPVFVILNTGIIHRVGHHRMYVTLARALAEAGYQVLRFDLSGIGDSESREDGLSLLDGVLADVGEVIDWLATARQARRIILVGLCAGADHALVYGLSDPRVCGVVLLDPSIPPTRSYYLRYFVRQLLRSRSWINFLTASGPFWVTIRKFFGSADDEAWERRRLNLSDPTIRSFLQNAYQRLMDLRIPCLAVFTSGLPHQHNYRRQILDAFPAVPFGDRLQLEYFAGSDHLFTSEADRKRLFGTVMAWAQTAQFTRGAGAQQNARLAIPPVSPDYVSYEV
jgi:pimeloyl-ACP methyl ester carboxylesterase